jgi:hypothetical protein
MHLQAKWWVQEFAVLEDLIINSEPSVNGNETDLMSHRSNTVHKLGKMKEVEWLAVIICFIFAYDKPRIIKKVDNVVAWTVDRHTSDGI